MSTRAHCSRELTSLTHGEHMFYCTTDRGCTDYILVFIQQHNSYDEENERNVENKINRDNSPKKVNRNEIDHNVLLKVV